MYAFMYISAKRNNLIAIVYAQNSMPHYYITHQQKSMCQQKIIRPTYIPTAAQHYPPH